jgi:hypothetical protein
MVYGEVFVDIRWVAARVASGKLVETVNPMIN